MPKNYSEYICQQCGYKSASFLGKCPNCGEWNSLVETSVSTSDKKLETRNLKLEELVKLSEVKSQSMPRISSGFDEFNRVLGGGIVPGSIVLISGDPGIGKSTLLLQAAMEIAGFARGPASRFHPASTRSGLKSNVGGQEYAELRAVGSPPTTVTPHKTDSSVLYVTGEESAHQVKIRADRIGKIPDNLFILPSTDVDVIVGVSEKVKPTLLIVDSIQTLTCDRLAGSAGSVGQVRECSQVLQAHAKKSHTPIFIVGHVTKEGNIAGPKVLEHLVDAVLNLEGDNMHSYRILRSTKNRFGSTFEVGVFEMSDRGMLEVSNPSQIFLAQRIEKRAGSVVASTITGERPILAEVQALTTSTIFGIPVRRTAGLDPSRVQIVIAALSKAANIPLGNLDIYVNVAGGLKIGEPAADLPVALAIASAALDRPLPEGTCAFGEVGLLGELRPVSNIKGRINEAKRLGFTQFISPDRFKTLEEAISYSIHGSQD
ncbi:MAG: magnesium chelatase domain-containing protein [Candidatus Curtissbacteria bacterium]|nr:magnesium chelatase domain-containing protein [Candidatus Curtissbacteria bacterium]